MVNLVVGLPIDDKRRLSLQADHLLSKCGKWCLLNKHYRDEAKEGLIKILLEMQSLSKIEKQVLIRGKIRESISIQSHGHAKCKWQIGEAPGIQFLDVCKLCFQNVYEVGATTIQKRISEIKGGLTGDTTLKLNDRTTVQKSIYKATLASARGIGLNQSRQQAAMMLIGNDMKKMMCYSWYGLLYFPISLTLYSFFLFYIKGWTSISI